MNYVNYDWNSATDIVFMYTDQLNQFLQSITSNITSQLACNFFQ